MIIEQVNKKMPYFVITSVGLLLIYQLWIFQDIKYLDWITLWLDKMKPQISKKSYNILKRDLGKYWMRVNPNPPIPHNKFNKLFSK